MTMVTVMPRAPKMISGLRPTVSMSGMLMMVPTSWVTLMMPAWTSWSSYEKPKASIMEGA